MSKRTMLKTLAFVCGLYFVLEFILPEKLGGDFDCDSVHSPIMVQTQAGPVILYVGQYNHQTASLGRLVPTADGASWQREPSEPVMQRALFAGYEKGGICQLDAVAGDSAIDLFYLGLDSQQKATLCHATGDASGLKWKKTGPVLIAVGDKPPRPIMSELNGELPGTVEFFAADRKAGRWALALVMQPVGMGKQVWSAEGDRLDSLKLGDAPLLPATQFPVGVTAFDAHRVDGRWIMDLAQSSKRIRFAQQANGAFAEAAPPPMPVDGDITGLRTDGPDGREAAGCRKTSKLDDGKEVIRTEIQLYTPAGGAAGAPQTVKTVGRPGQTTYLSQGMQTAGTYLQIIGAFAIFIALINLVMFHGKRIGKLQTGSVHSIIFFLSLATMALFTALGRTTLPNVWKGWSQGYSFMFDGVITPMSTTVFSMITFYMISAAYRSFRIRSLDAALLMLSACVVMIGQMPIGAWLGSFLPDSMSFLRLPTLADKLLMVANTSAYRGVAIGLAVGGFSIGLRIWLGLDNTVYSGMEDHKQ